MRAFLVPSDAARLGCRSRVRGPVLGPNPFWRVVQHQRAHRAQTSAPATASKKTWMKPDTAVQDFLQGLVATSPHLQRLDGYPEVKVVLNASHDKQSQVAIISGGGSGHEPAHAGFVGPGMLTAAVVGEVFASPSAKAVLAAIQTVTGPPGCLIIVKNYTGDRLHFGLAAEQAKALGHKVELVVVGEDVAIDTPGLAGRRGLAGTALVHKLAGAAAATGASLEEVAAVAQRAVDSMATLGVALGACTLPGKPVEERLGQTEMEIGLGIHGEPGHAHAPLETTGKLVQRMLSQMLKSPFCRSWAGQAGRRIALLVNNLGGSIDLEIAMAAGEALRQLQTDYKLVVERVYSGRYVTSLDMPGLSLTLLDLEGASPDSTLKLLDAPTDVSGWHNASAHVPTNKKLVPLPATAAPGDETATASGSSAASPEAQKVLTAMRAACDAIVNAAAELNELDKKVGDGDCGDTVALGARALLAELDANRFPSGDMSSLSGHAAHVVLGSVGGTSGALYGVLLTAAAASLKTSGASGSSEGSVSAWAAALQAGVAAVSKYGGAKAGSRTMLDALLPAAEALSETKTGSSEAQAAKAAADAAAAGAESTKAMAPAAGRSSYVPKEVTASIPDPGALAVAVWMKAVADSLA